MRILHLNEHLAPRGGVETYLLSAIPLLERDGHPQGVVFAKGEADLVDAPFQLTALAQAGRGARRVGQLGMQQIIQQFEPDIIHLHNIHNVGAIERCLSERPVVLTAHDYRYLCPSSNFYYRRTQEICQRSCSPACFAVTLNKRCLTPRPQYSLKYYRRVRWVTRNFARFAGLIAPSQSAADRFAQAGFPTDRITVLPYFCRVSPLAQPRPIPQAPLILFLGRLGENKGWQFFVQALGMLPEAVHGQIVGSISPENESQLTRLATAHGCLHRLSWRSWATESEIRDILKRTTLLVFPSLWPETLGIVGLEALAHGVPVVASDVGGVREWLRDQETGFLVPPKNAKSIAAACQRIIDSQSLTQRMGDAGLELIRQRFSPGAHLSQLVSLYARHTGQPAGNGQRAFVSG